MESTLDHAWAAGFFEGEGTIGYYSGIIMQANQQQAQPLDRLRDIYGGNVTWTRQKSNGKAIGAWYISGHENVHHAILTMLPWLSDRRIEQAFNALDRSNDIRQMKEYFCGTKAHVRTQENTAYRKNGARRCLACERKRWAEWKTRQH